MSTNEWIKTKYAKVLVVNSGTSIVYFQQQNILKLIKLGKCDRIFKTDLKPLPWLSSSILPQNESISVLTTRRTDPCSLFFFFFFATNYPSSLILSFKHRPKWDCCCLWDSSEILWCWLLGTYNYGVVPWKWTWTYSSSNYYFSI